jgi:DNA polymerase
VSGSDPDRETVPQFPDEEQRNPVSDDCRRCPGLVEARERICWGAGPEDADLVVVGEAPSAGHPDAETWRGGNLTGMAYSGRRSGRKIRTMLAELGYDDAYYTNAVKCYPSAAVAPDGTPTDEPHAENREPAPTERANCRPHLRSELAQVGPGCVLATGKHATQSLLGVEGRTIEGFLDLVLELQDCPTLGTPVLPVLHPSYQEVWIGRLGHTRESYLAAIAGVLDPLIDAGEADGETDDEGDDEAGDEGDDEAGDEGDDEAGDEGDD